MVQLGMKEVTHRLYLPRCSYCCASVMTLTLASTVLPSPLFLLPLPSLFLSFLPHSLLPILPSPSPFPNWSLWSLSIPSSLQEVTFEIYCWQQNTFEKVHHSWAKPWASKLWIKFTKPLLWSSIPVQGKETTTSPEILSEASRFKMTASTSYRRHRTANSGWSSG